MDNLISESLQQLTALPTLTLWELVLVLVTASVLNLALAWVYTLTHSGHGYSRSYVHTIVFVGITISLIMLIIGSNIARAFALVGAMSIIRFRNPVKDPRDIAFMFMAMAIGMAAGTKFYLFAVIFTAFISFVAVAMHSYGFGEVREVATVLRLRMRPNDRDRVEAALAEVATRQAVVSIDKLAGDADFSDFIYELMLRRDVRYEAVIARLSEVSPEISVTVLVGDGAVNV